MDCLMTRKEAADYLGVKSRTLEIWASTGRHCIPYVRIGREVRYRRADLDRLVDRLLITPVLKET